MSAGTPAADVAVAVALATAGATAAVLGHAALGHLGHRSELAAAVAEHGVVRVGRARAVALAVTAAEGALAVGLVAEALARPGRPAGTLGAACALFLAFAAYLALAARRVSGPGVDCGCGGLGGTVTPASRRRPAALAALPAAGLVAGVAAAAASAGPADVGWSWRLLAVAAAWTAAIALTVLAEARSISAAGLARAHHDHRLLVAPAPAAHRGPDLGR